MFSIQNVSAIPNLSPQDLYKASDMVFHGQVISKQTGPGPDYYYYQIKVDTYFKNPQTSDSVTVAGHKPVDGRMEYPQFEIGDKALFYTSKIDGVNTIGMFSQKAGMACNIQSFLGSAYVPDNTRPISGVASNPRITDINGDAVVGNVSRGQPIQITYDEIWNTYPEYKAIQLHMSIRNTADANPSFEENRTVFLNACDGPSPVKLNFVPEKNGTYEFSLNIDGKLTTATSFEVGGPAYSGPVMISSPLKQFKSGVAPKDIKCAFDLQRVIKTRNHSPACVKPEDISTLVERGWADKPNSLQEQLDLTPTCIGPNGACRSNLDSKNVTQENKTSSDALKLLLSTNSTSITTNQTLEIDIILNNTSSNILVKDRQDNWTMKDLNMGPCELDPVGIGVYEGNYSLENVTKARLLQLYQNGAYECPVIIAVDRYIFEPSSDKAISETPNGNSTGEMKYRISFDEFYTQDVFVPQPVGTYTIVADDEWGHTAIQHFTVIPPLGDTGKLESTNQNKTSSPLQLFLSIDSEYQNPAEPITIDVGLNNTGSVPLTLAKSDNWPRNDITSGLCSHLPFGISILKGYYTQQNMSIANSLGIYGLVPCPRPTIPTSYTFDPLSSKATLECDSLFSCPGLTDMKAHLVIPDFMYNGQHRSFDVGQYTIVAGDEWGHVAIKHFTEEYATAYSGSLGR